LRIGFRRESEKQNRDSLGDSMLTRRQFTKSILGSGLAVAHFAEVASPLATAHPSTAPDCDLLLKGGTVIDPGQGLHAPLDVAIKDGKILELSPEISITRARKVFAAKDKIVTPGLIDVHVHVFEGIGLSGINADQSCLGRGVTTAVDAGSAGYSAVAGFRKYIINTSATRIFAMVDICSMGLVVGAKDSMKNLEWVDPQLTARAANENKPAIVGIKIRLSKDFTGDKDLECLKRALEAAEASQLPLVVHIGDSYSPLPEIVSQMRKGDVLTHIYNNQPHGILDPDGKIIAEVIEARERGVLFDVGQGKAHLDFDVAEKCLQQNFMPDTISTDLAWGLNQDHPPFDLVTIMSEFLALGLSLDQVIKWVTTSAARMFTYGVELGSLRPGTVADISILEMREGTFPFIDSVGGKKRTGRQKLNSVGVIRAGQLHVT
jgi:dihydroorotase